MKMSWAERKAMRQCNWEAFQEGFLYVCSLGTWPMKTAEQHIGRYWALVAKYEREGIRWR